MQKNSIQLCRNFIVANIGGNFNNKFKIISGVIFKVFLITKINEKIIVVAPTTAVPIRTGFEVALNVFPAPSFSSKNFLAFSKSGLKP